MDYISLVCQIVLIIFILYSSNYIYNLFIDKKKEPIKVGDIALNRKSIIIVLYNFIIIALFAIINYNISVFSTVSQHLKYGKPYKLTIFTALYECFVTQTTVGFGNIEYSTNLIKFITMLQMSSLFINFGLITF